MKLNIDKEKILKNKFWILLVVAVPMILASQYIVLGPVAEDISKTRKKVDSELKKARDIKPPYYNGNNIEAKLKQAAEVSEKEKEIWRQLYARQEPSLFWPAAFEKEFPMNTGKFLRELKFVEAGEFPVDDKHRFTGKLVDRDNISITVAAKDGKKERFFRVGKDEMKLEKGMSFFNLPKDQNVTVTYQTGRYFGDQLSDVEISVYSQSYASQIRPILDIVDPVNDEGEGVVILKGEWFPPKRSSERPPANAQFLRFVQKWNTDADISEEAWIAQEDLWLQKEFYRLIRQANDYVGKMEGGPIKSRNVAGTFKNVYFELTLKLLSADKLSVTIRNLQPHRQRLEVKFKVRFTDEKGGGDSVEKILIEGEPLDPADPQGKGKDSLTTVVNLETGPSRGGIASVEQVLTWETAAVRRIDLISIGSLAANETSLSHRAFPGGVHPLKAPPKVDAPVDIDADQQRARVPKFPAGGRFDPKNPQAMQGLLVNGLIKDRYVEPPTAQTRRLPVAIVLIVDQDHVDRVLTSFSNSPFRFVLNQMLMNRYPNTVRPVLPTLEKGFEKKFNPRDFAKVPPAQTQQMTGEEVTEANVELVLYGTVTLYERYPPRALTVEAIDAAKQ